MAHINLQHRRMDNPETQQYGSKAKHKEKMGHVKKSCLTAHLLVYASQQDASP
jgi:hypothetical protein